MTAYKVQLTSAAKKELRSLDRKLQQRLAPVLRGLATDPRPDGVTKLTGYDHAYRVKVGDYRVLYNILEDGTLLVEVFRVAHRRDVYKGI